MSLDRWIAILTAFAVLSLPALSLADHHKEGGKAAEHRSEKAAENSNAQWDENNDGKPEKDHGDDDAEESEDDAKEAKGKKDKKAKKDKKESDE